jgi:hypothetical protein
MRIDEKMKKWLKITERKRFRQKDKKNINAEESSLLVMCIMTFPENF